MTLTTPGAPATAASRLRWTLADGWTLVQREFWHIKARAGP